MEMGLKGEQGILYLKKEGFATPFVKNSEFAPYCRVGFRIKYIVCTRNFHYFWEIMVLLAYMHNSMNIYEAYFA